MEILASVWHLFGALLVAGLGVVVAYALGPHFGLKRKRALLLYVWHALFCLAYLWYASFNVADATAYYEHAKGGLGEFSFGTGAVNFLTAMLVRGLDLSMLGAFLAFNIFGTVGLMAFDGCMRIAVKYKPRSIRRLASIIIFLPSVSFWSSAIGKDALSFMAAGLAMWAAMALDRRWLLMVFSVAVMALVRPHMAGMMVVAWTCAVMVSKRTPLVRKVILGGFVLTGAVVMVPFALQYAGLAEGVNPADLMDYVDQRQSQNLGGGSSVDIASMSLPMQLITYLFRPFIFEVNSVYALAAALDNLILLYLFLIGGRAILKGRTSNLGESRVFMWVYVLMAWPILAMTTANLGIAVRQKWMFLPMLVFLLISVIGSAKPKQRLSGRLPAGAAAVDAPGSMARPV